MPRTVKSDGFHCPLCGYEIEVYVIAYRSVPFIDGRYYEHICWVCDNVPKTSHFDNKTSELVVWPWRPDKINTLAEMKAEGWGAGKEYDKRINKSIRSVKSAIKSMNAEKRAEFIRVSKENESRDYVDLTEKPPEPPVEPKVAEKKTPVKKRPPAKHTRKKS